MRYRWIKCGLSVSQIATLATQQATQFTQQLLAQHITVKLHQMVFSVAAPLTKHPPFTV